MSRRAEQFDVAIVGARCAGSPLAALLARRGLRVCVVDSAHFPSETLSTHVIQPCGVRILGELGVLPRLTAAGAVPLDRFTLVNDDAALMKGIHVMDQKAQRIIDPSNIIKRRVAARS